MVFFFLIIATEKTNIRPFVYFSRLTHTHPTQTQADLIVLIDICGLPGFKVCHIPSYSGETWRGYNMNSLQRLEGQGLYFPPLESAHCHLLSHPVKHQRSARGSNTITCGTQCILELLQLLQGLPMVHTISSQCEWAPPKVKTEAKSIWCSMQCTDAKMEPTLEHRGIPKRGQQSLSCIPQGLMGVNSTFFLAAHLL